MTKGAVRPYLVHGGRVRCVVPLDPRGCWFILLGAGRRVTLRRATADVAAGALRSALLRVPLRLPHPLLHQPPCKTQPPPAADLFLSASEDGTVREFDVRQRPAAVHREALAGDGSNVLGAPRRAALRCAMLMLIPSACMRPVHCRGGRCTLPAPPPAHNPCTLPSPSHPQSTSGRSGWGAPGCAWASTAWPWTPTAPGSC